MGLIAGRESEGTQTHRPSWPRRWVYPSGPINGLFCGTTQVIQAFPCTCAGGQPGHSPPPLSLDIRCGHRASDTSLSHGARSAHGNMMLPAAARETLRVGRTDGRTGRRTGQRVRVARAGGRQGARALTGRTQSRAEGPGVAQGDAPRESGAGSAASRAEAATSVRSASGAGRRPGPPLAPPARSAPSAARALLVSGCQAAAARARRRWA